MKTPGEISKSQRVRNPQTAGMSLKDHLARVAEEKEHDLGWDTALINIFLPHRIPSFGVPRAVDAERRTRSHLVGFAAYAVASAHW
ncbi:hypothetical protein [Streptomyces goshikiensis]|uniref:hypothetical protein n=1 Tax=Streptomyces goshikiensis TaxID=1942 RepID=UPI0022F3D583|nr:hypothetical protein [Streptomyces goshikiensis]WBY25071.1 hypothetical protein PET44_35460 [Streptomyces goshikiensis]